MVLRMLLCYCFGEGVKARHSLQRPGKKCTGWSMGLTSLMEDSHTRVTGPWPGNFLGTPLPTEVSEVRIMSWGVIVSKGGGGLCTRRFDARAETTFGMESGKDPVFQLHAIPCLLDI